MSKKCYSSENDQPKPNPKPKGIVEVIEAWIFQSKDKAVSKTKERFAGVNEEEEERLEIKVIEDDREAFNGDDLREGSDEDYD